MSLFRTASKTETEAYQKQRFVLARFEKSGKNTRHTA